MRAQRLHFLKRSILCLLAAAVLLAASGCVSDEPKTDPDAQQDDRMNLQLDDPPVSGDGDRDGAEWSADIQYAVLKDRIVPLYVSSSSMDEAYCAAATALFDSLPGTLSKSIMLLPSRSEFETDDIRALCDDQKKDIDAVCAQMPTDVKTVDAYYLLQTHAASLDDLYFRLDHHWTHLASYYAATAYFESEGMTYHTLSEYTRRNGGAFRGYLYALVLDESLASQPDTLIYYDLPGAARTTALYTPDASGALVESQRRTIDPALTSYYCFAGESGFAFAVLDGDPGGERALLVVGDSYMNALGTWFDDSFRTVILLDPRYYTLGKQGLDALIAEYGVTDFLIANSIDTVATMGVHTAGMEALTR